MRIHVLRHAESVFNKYLRSEKNCDLTEEGRLQAKALEGYWDIVICSPLKRTRQTLGLSQIKYGELIETYLCREKRADICDFLEDEDETKKESDGELEERIQRFITFVKSKVSIHNSILIVAHGDFIHALGKRQQSYPRNAEIQTMEI